jgi:hypothetical protein
MEAGPPQAMGSDDAITGRRFYGARTQSCAAGVAATNKSHELA